MSVFSPAQTSFAGGELSPRLRGRVDADLYKAGLAYAENWQPTPQGSLLQRGALLHVSTLAAPPVRVIQFRIANKQDYDLVLTNLKCEIFGPDGKVNDAVAAPELVANGDFSAGGTGWTPSNKVVFSGWASLYTTYTRVAGVTEYFASSIQQDITSVGGVHRLSLDVLSIPASGQLGVSIRQGAAVKLSASISVTGTHSFLVDLPAGVYTLTLSSDDTRYPWAATIDNVSLRVSSGLVVAAPWTGEQLAEIQYACDTGKDRMILVHPKVPPHVITLLANGTWTSAPAVILNPPAAWSVGKQPAAVEIGQGRLWLANCEGARNTFWASVVGGVLPADVADFNFALGTSLPGDALSFNLQTKGAIRWMRWKQLLLIGTDFEEHSATGSTGRITPTDIQVRVESAFGSAKCQALHVGDQALYISADRRKVRALSFSLEEGAWNSRDLTWVAEHLTKPGIVEAHFARDFESSILLVLQDGTLALCTYNRMEKIAAWWRFSTPGGYILSAGVSDGPSGSAITLAVQRSNGLFYERYDPADLALDSAVRKDIPADLTITGLDHLEGETVGVVVDGAITPDKTVAGGQIVLDADSAGTEAVIGKRIRPRATTLPREGGSQRGTAQGAKRRNVRVRLRLNESALPLVDGNRAAPTRSAGTPMGSPEPPFTGDAELTCLGWADGAVTIEQDLPFRTEVLAIFANTAVNDL